MQHILAHGCPKAKRTPLTGLRTAGLVWFVFLMLCVPSLSALEVPALTDTLPQTPSVIAGDTLQPQLRRGVQPVDTLAPDTVVRVVPEPLPSIAPSEVMLEEPPALPRERGLTSLQAGLLSAAVPGLGQALKGQYWRPPAYYAGLGGIAYYWKINYDDYNRYKNALTLRFDDDPETEDEFPRLSEDALLRGRDHHKRNMQLSYGLAAGVYVFNILDASGVLTLPALKLPDEPHSPMKATMLSVALPGLGQAYNGKHWKIPFIYAGFGAVAYFVDWNNNFYQTYRRAYYARIDGNPNTVDDFPRVSTDRLRSAVNYYRRNLEVTYILGAALYVLNILDATVDAHLIDFDVSEDLGLKVQPAVVPGINPITGRASVHTGLTLSYRF